MTYPYKITIGILIAVFIFYPITVYSQNNLTILFVLDASARMAQEYNGKSKFQLAKECINEFFSAKIPAQYGLAVFGSEDSTGSTAYFVSVPPGKDTQKAIMVEINRIKPKGLSPLASGLIHGSQSFPTRTFNAVILVSDGVENTGGAPITAAETLIRRKTITRLDIVGFTPSVNDNPLYAGLITAGNGMYVPVTGIKKLITVYQSLLSIPIPEEQKTAGIIGYRCFITSETGFPAYGTTVELRNSAGTLTKQSSLWRGIFEDLPAGNYTLIAQHGTDKKTAAIQLPAGKLLEHNFVFNVATGGFTFKHLILHTTDGKAYGTITRVYHSNGETVYTGTSWAGEVNNLPEGEYNIEGYSEGLPTQTKPITIKSGTKPDVTFQFDVGKGRISYKCFLDLQKNTVANGTIVKIFRQPYNELASEQVQWRWTTPYLPTGSYTVEGNYKGIIRSEAVEIHPDSTTELNFIFNIQQVQFTYQCFRNEQKKTPATGVIFQVYNQQGKLIEESNRWRGMFTLPEGVYTIKATYENITKTKTLTLAPSNQQIVVVVDFGM
jgi:hypothetical protein